MKKVLVIGGSGQLGNEIRGWSNVEIVAPTHQELDLNDAADLRHAVERYAPDTLINCAAYHNVEACEAHPDLALAANALAVDALAQICAERAMTFVTFSTDYVFDGGANRPYTEEDAPHPLMAYGVSKFAGELLAQRWCGRTYIVRTCGVYGTRTSLGKGHTFIARIIDQARAGAPVRVITDQTVSPTYAGHLADAVRALLDADAAPGIYHAVNAGAVTWYEFACEALRQAGIDAPIEPVDHTYWESRVRRPAYSALQSAKFPALGIRLPDWRAGIAAYLESRRSAG